MKFQDRVTFTSQAAARRKWRRYWTHLADQGFTVADPVYRLFAGEVFHDGELRVRKVDLSSHVVVLELRNVYAVDAVCAADPSCRFSLNKRDFVTRVALNGVDYLRVRTSDSIERPIYQSSNLDREGDMTVLEIAFVDAVQASRRGRIRVRFASAEIEDIGRKIKKYLGRSDLSRVMTPIAHDPTHYLADAPTA